MAKEGEQATRGRREESVVEGGDAAGRAWSYGDGDLCQSVAVLREGQYWQDGAEVEK